MVLEMAHTGGKVIPTWSFLCHVFLIQVIQLLFHPIVIGDSLEDFPGQVFPIHVQLWVISSQLT